MTKSSATRPKKILIPLPAYGFDPTEAAISWQILVSANFEVTFITPEGKKPAADRLMLKGEKLGPWKALLRARKDAVDAYAELERDPSFVTPLKYSDVKEDQFNALLLPGGHDQGIKNYLESKLLQHLVADFFVAQKPVAAICHGVVLAARSINAVTGKSVLYDYKTTALLKSQERLAYRLTQLWLKDYYLTYPGLSVEDEVRAALSDPQHFFRGPPPLLKDSAHHMQRGFVVRDRHYISARWPGDVHRFAHEFVRMILNPEH